VRHFNPAGRWHPPGVVERVERWGLRRSAAVVAISNPTARLLDRYRLDVPTTVIPNGVDTERFRPLSAADRAEVRARLGLETPHVVGFVGTFQPFHGLGLLRELIIRTLHRSDLTWVLVGDGPARDEVAVLADHPRVRLLGRRPADEIPQLLGALDVVVAPHQREVKEFYFCPIKVLEGMAVGVPCLASNQGDIPELLGRDRAGLTVSTDDPDHWAASLTRLLNDYPFRCQLGTGARARVLSRYTWRHTAQQMEDVFTQAAERTLAVTAR
jgi:glycosyltransferase involved in cell wall biosynthesis